MSGPWDRPPSSNPDDNEWPAEDLGPGSSPDRPADPWSADDPWQERRDRSSDWDVWPAPSQPPEDYVVPEPEPPASDPWAESWTDEVPGIPDSPEPTRTEERAWEPVERFEEPEAPPAFGQPLTADPADSEPDPVPAEVVARAPEPEFLSQPEPGTLPEPEPEPEPEAEAVPPSPRILPWSPDADPWGAAPVEEWTWAEAEPEAEAKPEAEAEAEAEPPAEAVPEPEPEAAADEPEPEPVTAVPEPEPQPEPRWSPVEPAPIWDATLADSADPDGQPDVASFDWLAEPEPTPAVEPVAPEPELDLAPEPGAAPELEGTPGSQPLREPEALPEAEVAAEVQPEPDIAISEAPEDELETQPAALAGEAVAEAEADLEAEATANGVTWEPDRWPEPAPETQPEAEPEPKPRPVFAPFIVDAEPEPEPQPEPEPAFGAGALATAEDEREADAPREAAPAERPEIAWPEHAESTQVLPTSWAPTPPEARDRDADAVEPSAGEIRTSLRREEPDADDELAAEPTTAEQAVPWLIGVILLLAGMVIVLLALIFAGDASLGGSAALPSGSPGTLLAGASGEPSPEPSIATPRPTASAEATPEGSGSPEPTSTQTPGPQYGELEMVYQGRSAALAPIYLLRRDFTVEGDPEILAQDPSLDVRHFAWSPDGTAGAFLYAEMLFSIDPGVDINRLTDSIGAITFGDDAGTVYAVRSGPFGDDDVAAVIAVDRASSAEEELARVRYARPDVEGEAGLAEARFTDEGGAIRLFWTEDDTLLLWVLGAGAWTIDPEGGGASKLPDGDLPRLWSPDGSRRIGLTRDGSTTTFHLVDADGDELATTEITGLVSHLRWSPSGDQVVFTVGRSASGGGVLQDLYIWNLGAGDDPAPIQITDTGAAFGAEWLGSQPRWEAP